MTDPTPTSSPSRGGAALGNAQAIDDVRAWAIVDRWNRIVFEGGELAVFAPVEGVDVAADIAHLPGVLDKRHPSNSPHRVVPLVAQAAPRAPMTDEEIASAIVSSEEVRVAIGHGMSFNLARAIVRAVEAFHDIPSPPSRDATTPEDAHG